MRNIRMRMLAGVSSAAALLLMAGCQTGSKGDERSAGTTIDDQHISDHIQDRLDHDATYKFTDVRVVTFAGVVQLSGFVNTTAQKERAQEIAQTTMGVREVQNGVTLKPLEPTGTIAPVKPIYAPNKQGDPPDQQSQ